MREYLNKISLSKNDRGVYSLDTSIGCSSGTKDNKNGCYNDCYAAKSAKLYGYDFTKTVYRYFENKKHERDILREIDNIPLPFVRIGTSGDPSENWEHTLNVLKVISKSNKEIVIITKHWENLSDEQCIEISKMNICINTSVSALDKQPLLLNSVAQYNRLKQYCKSVLRIVSCDFNKENDEGKVLASIQNNLFKNDHVIDTVLRLNKSNPLIKNKVVNVTKSKFLGKNALISKFNRKTYLGKCSTCTEMCGVRVVNDISNLVNRRPLTIQTKLL
jgi:hypothetical protein